MKVIGELTLVKKQRTLSDTLDVSYRCCHPNTPALAFETLTVQKVESNTEGSEFHTTHSRDAPTKAREKSCTFAPRMDSVCPVQLPSRAMLEKTQPVLPFLFLIAATRKTTSITLTCNYHKCFFKPFYQI
jgi:hypothetical protein